MGFPVFHHEAALLKALAHRKRLEILHLLHGRKLTATEIERMTGFPQANLSQHLRLLKMANVIVAVRAGKHIRYRPSHPNFSRITDLLRAATGRCRSTRRAADRTQVQDPVCEMWVEPAASHFSCIFKGATFSFCASGCLKKFLRAPENYVHP